LIAMPADRQRKREAALDLGIGAAAQGKGIILLGAMLLARQIVSEAPVGGDLAFRRAERDRPGEQGQRLVGPLHPHQRRSHPGLYAPVRRVDLVGPGVKAEGSLSIAHGDGGAAGADQCVERARIVGQGDEVAAKLRPRAVVERLDDGPGRQICARLWIRSNRVPPSRIGCAWGAAGASSRVSQERLPLPIGTSSIATGPLSGSPSSAVMSTLSSRSSSPSSSSSAIAVADAAAGSSSSMSIAGASSAAVSGGVSVIAGSGAASVRGGSAARAAGKAKTLAG